MYLWESPSVIKTAQSNISALPALFVCVICLLAIVVSNMGQVDMSIAMLNKENILQFEVHV